jgi:hypothetical protein
MAGGVEVMPEGVPAAARVVSRKAAKVAVVEVGRAASTGENSRSEPYTEKVAAEGSGEPRKRSR